MPPISAHDLALEIIRDCLDYGRWPNRALDALIERSLDETDEFAAAAATRALFGVVVERLADLFEPQLCDVYAELFSRVIAKALPECNAEDLLLRYRNIRSVRPFVGGQIDRVFVLSRVTLGADIAVTSVALSAMKQRFPGAQICIVGPEKNAELFANDPEITCIPVNYGRGAALRERLLAAMELRSVVDEVSSLVVDPDSRLTQLGLIPICDDSRYYFFESRAYGGNSDLGLPQLAAMWLEQVFGINGAVPYVAPAPQSASGDCAVSWGVGENQDKRIGDEFEYQVLRDLINRGRTVILDRGAGGSEAARADALQDRIDSPRLMLHDGSYASFANQIMQSQLYVGYDSAGQHVAAASNRPLVSVFAGYACERMLHRWRPRGEHVEVIAAQEMSEGEALSQTLAAIAEI